MTRATVSADGDTITVHVPMTVRRPGRRKTIITPDRALGVAAARGRCPGQGAGAGIPVLDEAVCGTIEELAKREKVYRGYMSRVLRLTLLAPALDGRQPEGLRLEELLKGVPLA